MKYTKEDPSNGKYEMRFDQGVQFYPAHAGCNLKLLNSGDGIKKKRHFSVPPLWMDGLNNVDPYMLSG